MSQVPQPIQNPDDRYLKIRDYFKTSNFDSKYRGAQGLDPDIIKEIEKMYGMDKPAHQRFLKMLKDWA